MSERRRLMMMQTEIVWLYKDGVINTSLTGGFSFNNNGLGTRSNQLRTNNIYMYSKGTSASGNSNDCCTTAIAINLSNYEKLCIEYYATRTKDSGNAAFSIRNTKPSNGGYDGTDAKAIGMPVGETYKEIDVSDISGNMFVFVKHWSQSGWGVASNDGEHTLIVSKIWLE